MVTVVAGRLLTIIYQQSVLTGYGGYFTKIININYSFNSNKNILKRINDYKNTRVGM